MDIIEGKHRQNKYQEYIAAQSDIFTLLQQNNKKYKSCNLFCFFLAKGSRKKSSYFSGPAIKRGWGDEGLATKKNPFF